MQTPRCKICVASRCQVPNVGRNWKGGRSCREGGGEDPGPTDRCTLQPKMRGRGTKKGKRNLGSRWGLGRSVLVPLVPGPPSAARTRACEGSACFHLNFNARRTVPTFRAGSASRPPRGWLRGMVEALVNSGKSGKSHRRDGRLRCTLAEDWHLLLDANRRARPEILSWSRLDSESPAWEDPRVGDLAGTSEA